MSSESRNISPDELRQFVDKMRARNPDDVMVWLDGECNLEAAARDEAFQVDDKIKANNHAIRAERFGQAVKEMAKLRSRIEAFTEALQHRIVVAVGEAKQPAWKATHRHYKGTLYRATGHRQNAEGQELVDGIDYDDATGKKYWLPLSKWESNLESGRPRYQPLILEELK